MSDHNEDVWIVAIRGENDNYSEDSVHASERSAFKRVVREVGEFVDGDWAPFPKARVAALRAAIESSELERVLDAIHTLFNRSDLYITVTKGSVQYEFEVKAPNLRWPEET